LMSTASDYIKFAQMFLNEGKWNDKRYLNRKTLELMTINHVDEKQGPGAGFGLGVGMTTDLAKSGVIGSVGQYYWSGAYCTYFFVDPKEEMVAVLMTQTAPYSGYYNRKFRQFVYQAIND
jgi:CubicO group peptidase (beta-lactamase class C family)